MRKFMLGIILLLLISAGFIISRQPSKPIETSLTTRYVDDKGQGIIKGNTTTGQRIYHLPNQLSYENTKPEWTFTTEEEALNQGFRMSESPIVKWYSKYIKYISLETALVISVLTNLILVILVIVTTAVNIKYNKIKRA